MFYSFLSLKLCIKEVFGKKTLEEIAKERFLTEDSTGSTSGTSPLGYFGSVCLLPPKFRSSRLESPVVDAQVLYLSDAGETMQQSALNRPSEAGKEEY